MTTSSTTIQNINPRRLFFFFCSSGGAFSILCSPLIGGGANVGMSPGLPASFSVSVSAVKDASFCPETSVSLSFLNFSSVPGLKVGCSPGD